jgi:D-alanyl-D-alanine dipeptidase
VHTGPGTVVTYCLRILLLVVCVGLTYALCYPSSSDQPALYSLEDMLDVSQLNKSLIIRLAYSTPDNFLNSDVYGNLEACYLRKEVAEMLNRAQTVLNRKRKGYRLVVYDCLRPRSVQYEMWQLVKGTEQEIYVADPRKGSLHNFGAAVDVSIVDSMGLPLDMGTTFDYFGELAQPEYEERFFKEGKLTEEQLQNRKLLREVMHEAGFRGIPDEWWHYNAFSLEEVKDRYSLVEFLLPRSEAENVLLKVKDLRRDQNDICVLVDGSKKKLYLIEGDTIKLVFDVALGEGGLGKEKEGDHKTPLGDYRIKWMVSRSGPLKLNPEGLSSTIVEGKTYAVLDTELYFGNLEAIRVKTLPDGTRKVSDDMFDRPISRRETAIAQSEKLWTDAYGGKNAYVMALDYPNREDRKQGKTGSCIEIHASLKLEEVGYDNYTGTLGCISLYPAYAERVYSFVNPGTPVRIIE